MTTLLVTVHDDAKIHDVMRFLKDLVKRQKLVLPLDVQAWMQRALEKSNVAVVNLTQVLIH